MSDWKPGDVAMVECSDGQYRRAGYRRGTVGNPEAWEFEDGAMRRINESRTRPLVVIDPEDLEQIQRLRECFTEAGFPTATIQAALREFANPKPPKPAEPTNPAARVWANATTWAKCGPWWVSAAIEEVPREWDYLAECDDVEVQP